MSLKIKVKNLYYFEIVDTETGIVESGGLGEEVFTSKADCINTARQVKDSLISNAREEGFNYVFT